MGRKKVFVKENAAALKSFDEKKFNPKVIYQSDGIKVVLVYFRKGQFIPVHNPAVELVLCVLDGEALVTADDEKIRATKHDVIVVPKHSKRGIKALTELTLLHVVSPPPSAAEIEAVNKKLS